MIGLPASPPGLGIGAPGRGVPGRASDPPNFGTAGFPGRARFCRWRWRSCQRLGCRRNLLADRSSWFSWASRFRWPCSRRLGCRFGLNGARVVNRFWHRRFVRRRAGRFRFGRLFSWFVQLAGGFCLRHGGLSFPIPRSRARRRPCKTRKEHRKRTMRLDEICDNCTCVTAGASVAAIVAGIRAGGQTGDAHSDIAKHTCTCRWHVNNSMLCIESRTCHRRRASVLYGLRHRVRQAEVQVRGRFDGRA